MKCWRLSVQMMPVWENEYKIVMIVVIFIVIYTSPYLHRSDGIHWGKCLSCCHLWFVFKQGNFYPTTTYVFMKDGKQVTLLVWLWHLNVISRQEGTNTYTYIHRWQASFNQIHLQSYGWPRVIGLNLKARNWVQSHYTWFIHVERKINLCAQLNSSDCHVPRDWVLPSRQWYRHYKMKSSTGAPLTN